MDVTRDLPLQKDVCASSAYVQFTSHNTIKINTQLDRAMLSFLPLLYGLRLYKY